MLGDIMFLHQDMVGHMVPCDICGIEHYRRFDMDDLYQPKEKLCPDCRRLTRPPSMPYLIDYSLGCSTSAGEAPPGLDPRKVEEIAREVQEERERIFRELFKEHGFSLEAGDWLLLPESMGCYIPTALLGQVKASRYVQHPTFLRAPVKSKLEFSWEPRPIPKPEICWRYSGLNFW